MNIIDEKITYYSYLIHKCVVKHLRHLKYNQDSYSEKDDIISICTSIEKFLIDYFIKIVDNFIISFDDVVGLIQLYSANPNPTSKKILSLRQTCRYIFYILPSLKLTTNSSSKSDVENVNELCKLIAISDLIQQINQAYGIQSLVDYSCIEIKISGYFIIEYTNPFIIRLINELSSSSHLIHKSFYSEDILSHLMEILDNNSSSVKRIFDYTTDLWENPADVFEVTNETVNVNDPIINGLIFDEDNVNLFQAIEKPLNPHYRTRFRPFICLNIDGEKRTFSNTWLIRESLEEISMNLLPYDNLPKEWDNVPILKDFSKSVQKELGIKFENEVAEHIKCSYLVHNNITGFNHISLKKQKVPNTNRTVGQIDVIAIDTSKKTIYVIDAKCTKTKFFFQTFLGDKQIYKQYTVKLQDKINWISEHKDIVAQYFKLSSLDGYIVEGLFVSNSLIFFGFFSEIPIVPLDKILIYLKTKDIKTLIQ